MAGLTQTIPNYGVGGISEQPDQLKAPAQLKNVVNAIPDITYGLYKRPGAKRIGASPITNVQSGGSWFHYYRDETEGSYIGQVASDGKVRMWSCTDGTEKNVWYHTDDSAYNGSNSDHTAITSYLTPNPSSDTEDIQALTINDTTFLNNRSKTVATTGTTDARPDPHFAYVEILRSENGRQYALNLYNDSTTTTITRATRVKINSDTLAEGAYSGTCPGIGTQVFSGSQTNTGSKTNLTFRITALGQQGKVASGSDAGDYACTYNREINLLHGGEGWSTGDTTTQSLDQAKTTYSYTVGITEHESISVKANIKAVRPAPTPFDADTAVTVDAVIGGIQSALSGIKSSYTIATSAVNTTDNTITITDHNFTTAAAFKYQDGSSTVLAGLSDNTTYYAIIVDDNTIKLASSSSNATAGTAINLTGTGNNAQTLEADISVSVIGNGFYISCELPFNVDVMDNDLMRVMQGTVNDVTKLPIQCKHGYIVKVSNTRMSDEDDYFTRFYGANNQDGSGVWIECAEPGIIKSFDATTMPHMLQRQADGDFLVKKYTWKDRTVGDNVTNPLPSFVGLTINKVVFFRNRLVFLAGENVITSRPGTIDEPSFWNNSALTISAIDPVDISCASTYPSALFDAIEINTGLLCFSSNQQFLLSADDTVFNPDTAKLRSVSNYNYNIVMPPIDTGMTVGFIDNSNKYSRFVEMADIKREGEPIMAETSKLVPTLLAKDLDLLTNSIENNTIFFGKTDTDTVFGYRFFRGSDNKPLQNSWFRWKHNNPIKYHFCIGDEYYLLDTDNFLQKINLIQADTDPSIDQESINYLLHLDNYTTISGGVFSSTSNLTTFTHGSGGCVFNWQSSVTSPNGTLVVVDSNSSSTRVGRYAECTVTSAGATFTLPGDWSSATLNIGYLYEYSVDFPRLYVTKQVGESTRSDVNSKLTIHRIKLNFGKIGLYETTLTREGKTAYTEIYESALLNQYNVSDAPYLEEKIKEIPVYERNENVDITLKSSHPAPATLRSMSWEGDWSPMFYRSV